MSGTFSEFGSIHCAQKGQGYLPSSPHYLQFCGRRLCPFVIKARLALVLWATPPQPDTVKLALRVRPAMRFVHATRRAVVLLAAIAAGVAAALRR